MWPCAKLLWTLVKIVCSVYYYYTRPIRPSARHKPRALPVLPPHKPRPWPNKLDKFTDRLLDIDFICSIAALALHLVSSIFNINCAGLFF